MDVDDVDELGDDDDDDEDNKCGDSEAKPGAVRFMLIKWLMAVDSRVEDSVDMNDAGWPFEGVSLPPPPIAKLDDVWDAELEFEFDRLMVFEAAAETIRIAMDSNEGSSSMAADLAAASRPLVRRLSELAVELAKSDA